ncbi:MAG: hypothetical protein ABSF69_17005 [Polyangiaceae bacterium]|jgi:hypothetical protein
MRARHETGFSLAEENAAGVVRREDLQEAAKVDGANLGGLRSSPPPSTGTAGSALPADLPANSSPGIASAAGVAPAFGPTVVAAVAPPPISGGTLLVLADGVTAIVSDPDRDAVYVVDTATATVTATVALQAGDEPGALSRWQYRGRRGTR